MSDKSKVQIDIVGDNNNLDESLKQTEKDINTFGSRITSIFSNIASYTKNVFKDNVVKSFNNATNTVQQFTDAVKNAGLVMQGLNLIWDKSKNYLISYNLHLKESILLHKDLDRTNKLLGQSSGYVSSELQQYAEYLEKITKFSSSATQSAMLLTMRFRNIHGDQFLGATKAAQDLATELRVDLNTATQIVAEGLNNPIDAIEKFASVNILFDESEKKLIKSMMSANNVVGAQQVILSRLAISFGGAAKAAGDTFVGKLERLKNLLNTIATQIGERFLNKLNAIFGAGEKGKQIFDSFLKKIEEWGKVAIAAIDVVMPKIVALTQSININFESVYNWLIDQTITVFSTIETIFQNTSNIIFDINNFIFASFTSIWNGISSIFTDIIPKSLRYMVKIFNSALGEISLGWIWLKGNLEILWIKLQRAWNVLTNNIAIEFDVLKVKLITSAIKTVAHIALYWAKLFPFANIVFSKIFEKIVKPFEKSTIESMRKTSLSISNVFNDMSDFLDLPEFENPFKNVKPPDFSNEINGLQQSVNLTGEWDDLMNDLNQHTGHDFQENIKENKRVYDDFIKNIKDKAAQSKDLFKPPSLEANKRKDDDKKNKSADKFTSAVHGLEDFWYKSADTETDKNTKATNENTKELKKKALKEIREEKKTEYNIKKHQQMMDSIKTKKSKETFEEKQEKEKKRKEKHDEISAAAQQRSDERMNVAARKWLRDGSIGKNPWRISIERDEERRKRNSAPKIISEQQKRQNELVKNRRDEESKRLARTKERLAAIKKGENPFENPDRKLAKTTNSKGQSDASRQKDKVALQEAFRSSNKELVTEMKSVNDNTKKIANKKVGVA